MSINQERCYPTHYGSNRNFMRAGVEYLVKRHKRIFVLLPDNLLLAFVLNQIGNGGTACCAGNPTEGLKFDGGREPPALKRVDKLPSCLRQKRRRGHSH
jgi:hypothetical protein